VLLTASSARSDRYTAPQAAFHDNSRAEFLLLHGPHDIVIDLLIAQNALFVQEPPATSDRMEHNRKVR
jgi:hypothetical protein